MAKEQQHDSFGDIIIDFGKLTFAGIVLGSILATEVNKLALMIVGIIISLIFVAIGMYSNSKQVTKKEE